MSGGYDAIVFDLDGTLLDTLPDSRAALNRVLAEDSYRSLSLGEVQSTVGDGARAMMRKALALAGRDRAPDDAALDSYVGRYLAAYLEEPTRLTAPYPGVPDTLALFAREGRKLGICTNKPRATTEAVLARLGIDRYFAAVVCPEDVARRKPDGAHLLTTLDRMGASRDRAVFVGDSETDMATAIDAGVAAVAVSYGYCHAPVETLPADLVVESFADLPRALARLAKLRGLA
jgi:phosphoglycolate phosphatase